MNKGKYTGYPARNFPLSTQSLDFIEQQLQLVAQFAKAAGGNFILSGCQENSSQVSDGTVIIAGEIMPFKGGTKQITVRIIEEKESVTAGSYTYQNAYTKRHAEFGANPNNVNTYDWESFKPFPTNKSLYDHSATKQELEALQSLAMPKGAIIMWSGSVGDIPAGYVLCDGRPAVNGLAIPDLRGRFIAGYYQKRDDEQQANSDLLGDYGAMVASNKGLKEVTLSADQIPVHAHNVSYENLNIDGTGSQSRRLIYTGYDSSKPNQTTSNAGGGKSHENRPPFYVLAFIIKTV